MTTDTSQSRLSYVAEVTEGTTPASPAFINTRMTGESLKPSIQNVSSNEIRADRNVPDLEQVGQSAGGAVNFELSYGAGMMDDWLEALMNSTWSANVLKNGSTPKFFTLEKFFEAGTTDQYHRFTGSRLDTLSLAIRANQIVTGSFGWKSRTMTSAQAIIASATYAAVSSNPIINAANNFASLAMTGVSSPQVLGINLSVSNNLRYQPVLGAVAAKGIGLGRFTVTGNMDLYFETNDLMDLFLAGTAADLAFKLGGASSKNYLFNMGNIKFSDAQVLNPGADQDVMANVQFQAIYYATDTASLKITRTP